MVHCQNSIKYVVRFVLTSLVLGVIYTNFYVLATIQQPPIILRSQWGADESLRLGYPPLNQKSNELKGSESNIITSLQKQSIADNYLVTNFPSEFHIDMIVKSLNNKSLLRPVQFNNSKIKIIIHHTAQSLKNNPTYEDEVNEMQNIYKFHTITRKRGDIGYNYIIGPSGTIFEGRVGSPGSVGAHAVNNNAGSIGIALMGNFESEEPTSQQLQSLIDLTAWLAKKYQIDVYKKVSYHKSHSEDPYIVDHFDDSLVGHKDTGDTSCPGVNLYNKIKTIKEQVSALVGTTSIYNPTPTITDSTKYYIPSITYQLSIPRETTNKVDSCSSVSTVRDVKKCTLADNYLTLHLNKLTPKSHYGYNKFLIKTSQGNYYLYLSLEYRETTTINSSSIKTIPSVTSYFTGSTVKVILSEVSKMYDKRVVVCSQGCMLTFGNLAPISLKSGSRFQISKSKNRLLFRANNKSYPVPSVVVSNISGGVIIIDNYGRTYNQTTLNARKGSLTRLPTTSQEGTKVTTGIVVYNTVRVDDYMRGLIQTQADSPQSYHDVRYLIAHTNLRYRGSNITDSPSIHQYYGGYNAEKLDYKRQLSHDLFSKKALFNDTNLTYAPWFECSSGWTANGIRDIGSCNNPASNTLGLSRWGAQILSQRGYTARQIIEYYYPGISIKSIQ